MTPTEDKNEILENCPTIPHLAMRAAEKFGSDIAIEEDGTLLTFAELDQARRATACAFLASGVQKGDRVALWAPNLSEWIFAALGAQTVGAVIVLLNTRYKGKEAAYILKDSGARFLLTVTGFLDVNYPSLLEGEDVSDLEEIILLRGEGGTHPTWQQFLNRGEKASEQDVEARFADLSSDDISDMLFTSGTTGHPKGVVTAHGQNIRTFETWSRTVGLRRGDRYLLSNPFFHSFGYKAGWLSCLMRGVTMLPHPVFDAQAVINRISTDRISALIGPPAIYQMILADPESLKKDLSSLRLAVTGAAPVSVELVERMRDELKFEVVLTAYGMTETCGVITMCERDDDAQTISETSGKAIEGVEVLCVDDNGAEVPRSEPGEIIVRGYNVMRGYFGDETATADAIDASGWLHTGDLAIMDERGYVQITGRKKDMFITGGFNCYPAEIENMMTSDHRIMQAAVIGVPDERMGEVAKAFIVLAPGETLQPEEVIAWCRDNMANYKAPRHVEIVEALPMNASGKVQKFLLK